MTTKALAPRRTIKKTIKSKNIAEGSGYYIFSQLFYFYEDLRRFDLEYLALFGETAKERLDDREEYQFCEFIQHKRSWLKWSGRGYTQTRKMAMDIKKAKKYYRKEFEQTAGYKEIQEARAFCKKHKLIP